MYRLGVACLLIVAVLQFCLFLDRGDVTGSHEGRVMGTAAEMVRSGDWIVPRFNGEPRLQKPPLPYWVTAAAWSIAGSNNAWLARLPVALLGVIATLLIIDLGRMWLGRFGGLVSGMVWVGTFFVVSEFRKVTADPYLAFFTLAAVWSWLRAERGTGDRNQRTASAWWFIIGFWAAMALGAMAKGPVMPAQVALAIVPLQIARRRWPSRPAAHAIGVLFFLAIALPWPLAVMAKLPNALEVWRYESVGGFADNRHKEDAWWTYGPSLLEIALPWTVIFLCGLLWPLTNRRRRDARIWWPLAWLLASVVFFSLAHMKKNAYLLPLMPAVVLLVALPISYWARKATLNAGQSRLVRHVLNVHALVAAAYAGVMLVLAWRWASTTYAPVSLVGLSAVGGIVAAVTLWTAMTRPRIDRLLVPTALAFAIGGHVHSAWIDPVRWNADSPRMFLEAVHASVGDLPLCSIGTLPEESIYYLDRVVPEFGGIDDIPRDYSGFLLVRAGQLDRLGRERHITLTIQAEHEDTERRLCLVNVQ